MYWAGLANRALYDRQARGATAAAVLAADIAGYSRLMGRDEERTLAQLKALREILVDPKIAEHPGRIVKTAGDGMLAEFAGVVDAARCAVDIQRNVAANNAAVPQNVRIEFRVGIHVAQRTYRSSLTWDRGKELADHQRLTLATEVEVYFCDPRSPWQRGSNENTNRLLRQYLPRGTDLSCTARPSSVPPQGSSTRDPKDLAIYQTPAEKFAEFIAAIG
jgi:hypothetical protein